MPRRNREKSRSISTQKWQASGESFNRGYRFTYDALNRLSEAVYGENDFSDNINDYNEKVVEYSANGMMKRFQRRGLKSDGEYGKVDRSTFGRLQGKNLHITLDGNRIQYVYSPEGQKLRATWQTAVANIVVPLNTTASLTNSQISSTTRTDYVGNVIYTGTASSYATGVSLSKYLFEGGYATVTPSTQPVFHFYTQDHLGNNRAVMGQGGTVEQITHYYPFGGFFADAGTGSSLQPYKYNGKELDRMHGLDLYDYGARQYDPIVPMFTQQDPLAEKYYHLSPYVYCGNNPVNAIDPDGMDWLQARGDSVLWYGGDMGDTSDLKYSFASTSGFAEYDGNGDYIVTYQVAEYQSLEDLGPTPEGEYEINLLPSPNRHAQRKGNIYLPNNQGGIEMTEYDENGLHYSSASWGKYRAHLTPKNIKKSTKRNMNSFYIHDSEKGYTHGCIEVEHSFFDLLFIYRMKNKTIGVKVQYPHSHHVTNGGTRK